MINLQGIGIFVWQESQCEHGDWNAIVQKCKAAGIKWIVAKSGDSSRYSNWTTAHLQEVIQICHNNGLLFGTWNYSIPTTTQAQITQIQSLFKDGVDLHLIDAEIEFQTIPNANEVAETFMQELRAAVGNDVFIGHAPFSIVNYHPSFPYAGFGKYVDAVCDQAYWTEFNWTVQKTISLSDEAWANFNKANPDAAKPRFPIGVSYGQGYPGVPGPLNAVDIQTFMTHYSGTPFSFYSYDAAFPLFWETLTAANTPVPIPAVEQPVAPPAAPVPPPAVAAPVSPPAPVAASPAPSITPQQVVSFWDKIAPWLTKIGKWIFSIR